MPHQISDPTHPPYASNRQLRDPCPLIIIIIISRAGWTTDSPSAAIAAAYGASWVRLEMFGVPGAVRNGLPRPPDARQLDRRRSRGGGGAQQAGPDGWVRDDDVWELLNS